MNGSYTTASQRLAINFGGSHVCLTQNNVAVVNVISSRQEVSL